MSQNRSSAVMAQRVEPNDSLDDFPTMPWGTRGLLEHVIRPIFDRGLGNVWEPACNRGYMARPLTEYFEMVWTSDVHDYGFAGMDWTADFLFPGTEKLLPDAPDWIITNPPFRLAEQFIAKARAVATVGCAMLVRTSFLESVGRWENLFKPTPPTIIAQFVERIAMVRGRMDRKASSATSYCWLIWIKGEDPKPFQWIPPCRAKLERDSDYPA